MTVRYVQTNLVMKIATVLQKVSTRSHQTNRSQRFINVVQRASTSRMLLWSPFPQNEILKSM